MDGVTVVKTGFNVFKLVGVLIMIFAVLGLWGGLSVLFNFINPLASVTLPIFGLTQLFFTDFAGILFWLIIILLGLTFLTPKHGGFSSVLNKKK